MPVNAAGSNRNLDQGNKNPAQAKLGRGTQIWSDKNVRPAGSSFWPTTEGRRPVTD
jgi:hypothetical protein